jgi:hypothetical protein
MGTRAAIVELRQYTLKTEQREVLIALFERHFIEPQEEAGARVIGHFRDLDDPDRFVWLRGFPEVAAAYVTEASRNNYPALPVREGENVLVWFARSPTAPPTRRTSTRCSARHDGASWPRRCAAGSRRRPRRCGWRRPPARSWPEAPVRPTGRQEPP